MTPSTAPITRPPLDQVTGHVYTLPVVRETPIRPAAAVSAATW